MSFEDFLSPGGSSRDLIGSPIASEETIFPTHLIHHVSGTETIKTITPPYESFSGPIYLIADDTWSWNTEGNIAIPGAARLNQANGFLYSRSFSKWYPFLQNCIPFTITNSLSVVVLTTVYPIDFTVTAGSYSSFEIGADPAGPFGASLLLDTPGLITVYIRGTSLCGYLILPATVNVGT
jgi:hypothetical protein